MTGGEWLARAEKTLSARGCPDARADAQWILSGVMAVPRGALKLMTDKRLSGETLKLANARLTRRAAGEPLQYIENAAWFMGLEYYVDARALIPRPDTETLCEAALKALDTRADAEVLDLCAGSGALAIAIKRFCPGARVTATDISADALDVARLNAERLNADIEFLTGDLFAPLDARAFDIIVCNPPYLTRADMLDLQPEVRLEPPLALMGGEDGLDFYRRIAARLNEHMKPGARALFEVGAYQAARALDIIKSASNAVEFGIIKDICGIDRVIWIRSV